MSNGFETHLGQNSPVALDWTVETGYGHNTAAPVWLLAAALVFSPKPQIISTWTWWPGLAGSLCNCCYFLVDVCFLGSSTDVYIGFCLYGFAADEQRKCWTTWYVANQTHSPETVEHCIPGYPKRHLRSSCQKTHRSVHQVVALGDRWFHQPADKTMVYHRFGVSVSLCSIQECDHMDPYGMM